MGLAAIVGLIVTTGGLEWLLFLRDSTTLSDFLRSVFATACCLAAFYALSTIASTFLGDFEKVWFTMGLLGLLIWLTGRYPPPPAWNVFRIMGENSPLFTHTLPWPAMSVSLALTAAFFFIAVKVVQTREY
jgi:hypothetical protein